MTSYYKATRLDGRDFYSATIDYAAALASGEVVRHPAERMVRDDASTYLSVSTSPADCTRFRWPCRLFRVEPVGRVMGAGKVPLRASPNKRACRALRVVEELPAWQALGPNGEAVAALIEKARTITPEQAKRLVAARDAAWVAAWDAALVAARVAAWVAAWDAALVAARDAAWAAARAAAWGAAWAAVWDAALALVVRDLITAEHFDHLYGSWRSVMEEG